MANFVCFLAARAAEGRLGRARRGAAPRGAAACSTHRPRRTRGSRRPRISSASAPTPSAGFRPTRSSAWTWPRCAARSTPTGARGVQPFLVVGTAGSVSTGAIDPLPRLRRCAASRGCGSTWTALRRVGGGGAGRAREPERAERWPIRSPSIRTSGSMRRSKPAACWCAIAEALRRAFSYHPAYYHFDEQVVNFFELGPQNSRGFRALKVWLALRQVGRDGYRRMIADDMLLARHLYERVSAASGVRAADAVAQHHDVPLCAGRICGRRLGERRDRNLSRSAQSASCSSRSSRAATRSCRTRS